MKNYKKEWLYNVKGDILSSMLVAIALIPEAIGFSILAGVNPMVGLYASFLISIITAIAGATPGMISAATGAMALIFVSLVKNYGIDYLFIATILTGIIQILLGFFNFSYIMRFIPRSVMTGFVNSLAILIFSAQLPHFKGASIQMYLLVVVGLLIIYLLPKFSDKIPSALVAIIALSAFTILTNSDVKTVGDMGELTTALPKFYIPFELINMETLKIVLPYSMSLAVVGLLESLLTSSIICDMNDIKVNSNRECVGQGLANIVTGMFGGMAGCAMLGQSLINVTSGGKKRLSSLLAGVFLIILIFLLNPFVTRIPIAALVAVMVVVSINTFEWESLKNLKIMPVADSLVMLITIVSVVFTHNLAKGVFVGILISKLIFVAKISKINVDSNLSNCKTKRDYIVSGQVFFASVMDFVNYFDYKEDVKEVNIDFSNAKVWDDSAVGAIDKIIDKYKNKDIKVNINGLNDECKSLIKNLTVHPCLKKTA